MSTITEKAPKIELAADIRANLADANEALGMVDNHLRKIDLRRVPKAARPTFKELRAETDSLRDSISALL